MGKVKHFSCNLAGTLGEKNRRTFSQSTADGINHITDGVIEYNSSDVAHVIMGVAGVSLGSAMASKNTSLLVLFIVLLILILIFWG